MAERTGDSRNNVLEGTNSPDLFFGFAGDDTLIGLGARDRFFAGSGNDTIDGGADTDLVSYEESGGFRGVDLDLILGTAFDQFGFVDRLISVEDAIGTNFIDLLQGNDVGNELRGEGDVDLLVGRGGDDRLFGGADDDLLNGGEGADTIDGGAGADTLRYHFESVGAVRVDLAAGTARDAFGDTDTLVGIENVTGTEFDDTIIGDALANVLDGADGSDILEGRGGNDVINGFAGRNPSPDIDAASYASAAAGVTVDLAAGVGRSAVGDAAGVGVDQLKEIENAIGGSFDDALFGDAGVNELFGNAGADRQEGRAGSDHLSGGVGNDRLIGGAGSDTLRGGAGGDTFEFEGTGLGQDTILDFRSADTIVLKGLAANGDSDEPVDLDSNGDGRINAADRDVDRVDGDLTLDLAFGLTIILENLSSISASDIITIG